MVPFNLKVLAKCGLCSNWSHKFDECSLARARKIFTTEQGSTLRPVGSPMRLDLVRWRLSLVASLATAISSYHFIFNCFFIS